MHIQEYFCTEINILWKNVFKSWWILQRTGRLFHCTKTYATEDIIQSWEHYHCHLSDWHTLEFCSCLYLVLSILLLKILKYWRSVPVIAWFIAQVIIGALLRELHEEKVFIAACMHESDVGQVPRVKWKHYSCRLAKVMSGEFSCYVLYVWLWYENLNSACTWKDILLCFVLCWYCYLFYCATVLIIMKTIKKWNYISCVFLCFWKDAENQ